MAKHLFQCGCQKDADFKSESAYNKVVSIIKSVVFHPLVYCVRKLLGSNFFQVTIWGMGG
jgi:hypothetical protein